MKIRITKTNAFLKKTRNVLVGDEYELWVQYSRTEEDPKWELMGKYHELETK